VTLNTQQRWTLGFGVFFTLYGMLTVALGDWVLGGFFIVVGVQNVLVALTERLRISLWVQRLFVILVVVWGLALLYRLWIGFRGA